MENNIYLKAKVGDSRKDMIKNEISSHNSQRKQQIQLEFRGRILI